MLGNIFIDIVFILDIYFLMRTYDGKSWNICFYLDEGLNPEPEQNYVIWIKIFPETSWKNYRSRFFL